MIKIYLIDNDNYYCVLSFGISWLYIRKMTHLYRKIFTTVLSQIFGSLLILGASLSIYAKPEMKPLPANIAEIGSAYYSFKVKKFTTTDQNKTYRVWLGIPKTVQKTQNAYASVFMLDGNAAMSHLKEEILKSLYENDAPVLVAIGYKTNLPFATAFRSLDYTPADLLTGKPAQDPRNPERMSGGSADFRNVILKDIAPWVEQNVKLDAQKRALWGHSYGGLFVLDSLLDGRYFRHFFAASPSLSWADERMMQKIRAVKLVKEPQKHVLLMEGDLLTHTGTQQSANFDANGINKNREILSIFDQQGVEAKFLIYPNLKHGEVFKASLLDVLSNKLY